MDQFVTALVKLAKDLSFDGWLINIENKLSPEQIPLLLKMLRDLTGDYENPVLDDDLDQIRRFFY